MALIPEERKQQYSLIVIILLVAGGYLFHSGWYTDRREETDQLEGRLEQLENQNRSRSAHWRSVRLLAMRRIRPSLI